MLITGSLAIATGSSTSKAIAGAIAVNTINNDTDALIEQSRVIVTGGDVVVEAKNDSQIITVAMGGAGAAKVAVAGSVGVNTVGSEARAKVIKQSEVSAASDSAIAHSGQVKVDANDSTTITSVVGAGGITAGSVGQTRWGVGAALSVITIGQAEGTLAIIEDSDVSADDQVIVKAKNDNQVTGVTAAIAAALGSGPARALAVSVGVVDVNTNTRASVRRRRNRAIDAKKGLTVEADDESQFLSVVGGSALAGQSFGFTGSGSAGGASVAFNNLNQDVTADINAVPVTATEGSVVVKATSRPTVTSIAAGAAVGGTRAAQGSFAISVIDTDTDATITGAASTILADGNVAVIAEDRAKVVGVGGSVSLAAIGGSSSNLISSVGIANGTVFKSSDVNALIDNDITVQANGNRGTTAVPTGLLNTNNEFINASQVGVAVAAVSNATITNVAAGGAISGSSGGTSIAGSATVTVINDDTTARIGDRTRINNDPTLVAAGANANALQSVTVAAADRTKLVGIAGAAGISFGSGGIGAGVDVAFIDKRTDAKIGANADVDASSEVIVDAFSVEDILSVSASVGVGKTVGVAFGVGVSVFNITTTAGIGNSSDIDALGSVIVAADDQLVHELGTGSGGLGGGSLGGAGSFGVPVVTKTTTATIGNNAKVDGYAIRGAIPVPTGDFTGFGAGPATDGELGQADLNYTNLPVIGDQSYYRDRKAQPVMNNAFQGVNVSAISSTSMEVYAGGAGIGEKIGIAGSLAYAKADETTTASIGTAAEVNQGTTATAGALQSVNVAAGNDLFMRHVSGALAVGGKGAAGFGANLITVRMDTKAEIQNTAKVDAERNVAVRAFAEQDIIDVAVSAAGSGGVFTVAGSVAVLDLVNTTNAIVGDSVTVTAGGNVNVFAEDRSDIDLIAGGASLAANGGGIGASIGVSLLEKDTNASIGASTIDALGNADTFSTFTGRETTSGNAETASIRGVGVGAYASEDVFLLTVAGSGGLYVAIAGAVSWQKFDSDTTAEIKNGADINQASGNATSANAAQDVYVVALNNLTSTSTAGALGGSVGFGIGGGIDVGTVDSATVARLGGDVTARQDVRVASTADRYIRSIAGAGSTGWAAGISGGISLWSIGGDVGSRYSVGGETSTPLAGYNSDGSVSTNTVNTETEAQINNSFAADSGYSSSASQNRSDNSRFAGAGLDRAFAGFGSFLGKLTTVHSAQTQALILPSANVTAGDDVEVEARDDNDVRLRGGAVSAGIVGLGAGIATLNITTPVEASIGRSATVTATGDVDVLVNSKENLGALALAGSGALIGGAASYGQVINNGSRSASLRTGVSIVGANSLDVLSSHTGNLSATAGSGAFGKAVAGVSGARVQSSSKVEAFTQDVMIGTSANPVGNININATSDINNGPSSRMAEAKGMVGGAITATGVSSTAIVNPEVAASIGANSSVYSSGSVSVIGAADQEAKATALGVDVGVVSFGVAIARSTIDPNVQAVIGDSTVVRGASIEVTSLFNVNRAGATGTSRSEAKATSGKGGVFQFSGATATAEALGSTATTIGSNTDLESTTTDVVIQSNAFNNTYADGDGNVVSLVGLGDVNARSVADTLSQVSIGNATKIRSKNDVRIAALSHERIDSKGNAGDLGAVPISRADGTVQVANNTNVLISSGADLNAFNTLAVVAEVDHWSRAEGRFRVPGLSLGSNIKSTSTSTIGTTVDVDVFAANLTGQNVDVVSRVKSLDATSKTDAVAPVSFGDNTDATSRLTTTTATDVDLLGTTILGRDSVDILSEHPGINTISDAFADSSSLGGSTDAIAENTANVISNISADSATTLTTAALKVRSNVPSSRSVQEDARRSKGLFDPGSQSDNAPTENISREIDFNARVNVAEAGPVLIIGADGNATTQQGGITFVDNGPSISVGSVSNAGDFLGSVAFEIPDNIGTRTLKGTSTYQRDRAFVGVTIRNESAKDLQIGNIDVYNRTGAVQVNQTLGITNSLTFTQLPATTGSTLIDIQNTQGVSLDGLISNPFGTTSILATTGDIVRSSIADDVMSAGLKLEARAGNIGRSANSILDRFESRAQNNLATTDLELIASGNIYHYHSVGRADITDVSATTGDIDLFSVRGIFEDDDDSQNDVDVLESALFTGRNISIRTQGSIGSSQNPIEINAGTGQAKLTALGTLGVYVTELTDGLRVQDFGASSGDVVLTLTEAIGPGQTFELDTTGFITASGSATLNLPDDARFPAGSDFNVSGNLVINLDTIALAGDGGATLLLDAPLNGTQLATIQTGPDADRLDLRRITAPMTISTGAGNDLVKLSSPARRLDSITASTKIDTGSGADQLIFDAGGVSNLRLVGSIIASPESDYTSRLTGFELFSPVDFTAAEQIDLILGASADQATIETVDDLAVLNVFAGSGDDTITVGSSTGGVDAIQGRLNLDGGSGTEDQLLLDDASNQVTKRGTLGSRTVTGLGMGNANEGVRYDQFESLTLDLGTSVSNTGMGQYQLDVSSLSTPTAVNLGAGSDSVRVGNSLFAIESSLAIRGGNGLTASDDLTIESSSSTALTIDATTITGRELGGIISYSELENLNLELSNAPDFVSVENTAAALRIRSREGADEIQIGNVSNPATVELGSDTDLDRVTIRDTAAPITVLGDRRAIDIVDVDLRSQTNSMNARIEDSTLADTYEVIGATAGKISATGVTDLLVRFGEGNDTTIINTALNDSSMGPGDGGGSTTTPTTELVVDGGAGLDEFTVRSLDGLTIVRGGGNDDSVTVPIAGVPDSTQFNRLRLDIEQLTVDNRLNTAPVAWSLSDLSLSADTVTGNAPTGSPVVIVGTGGVDRTRILGGTANDLLDIQTTTITETFGEIDLDSGDNSGSDRVQLDFGGEVFRPDRNATLNRSASNLDFSRLVSGLTSLVENGLEVITDGTLVAHDLGGPVLGTGNASDIVTIRPRSTPATPSNPAGPLNYSLTQTGAGTAPQHRTVGGWDGDFIRLTHAGESGQAAAYVSNQVLTPWTGIAEYAFDLRSSLPGSSDGSDGWGWALLNTAQFGTSGGTGNEGPEPSFAQSLGVGLDVFDNGGESANSVSIHYDGSLILSAPLVSTQTGANPLESGNPLRVAIKIRPDGSNSRVSVRVVDLVTREVMTPITEHLVNNLAPYQGRVQISGTTVANGISQDIDNVAYQYNIERVDDPDLINTQYDRPTTPVVSLNDFESRSSAQRAATNNSAMVLYALDVTATTTGTHQLDLDVTYLNGTTERVTNTFTVAQAGEFQTIELPELNRYLSSVSFSLASGVRVDNIVAVTSKPTVLDFGEFLLQQGASSFRGDRVRTEGFIVSAMENDPADGLVVFEDRLQSGIATVTATLRAENGTSFTLQSVDFYNNTPNAETVSYRGITANGSVVQESLTIPSLSKSTHVFTSLIDVDRVEFDLGAAEIENIHISQALISDVPASVMPTPVPSITDRSNRVDLVIHTGDLLDADGTNNDATIKIGNTTLTSFNGTPFTVQYLDFDGRVVNTPVANTRYTAQFNFEGDFYVPDGSSISVTGANALSLNVANDAFIGQNVRIDVSGGDAQSWTSSISPSGGSAVAGGGSGGSGGGGAIGGSGGQGGNGGSGGAGGLIVEGQGNRFTPNLGLNGSIGNAGLSGTPGSHGVAGTTGASSFGGQGGAAGNGGLGGGNGNTDQRQVFSGGRGGGFNSDSTGASGQGGNPENKGAPFLPEYYDTRAGDPFAAGFGQAGNQGEDGFGGFNQGNGIRISAGSGGGGAGGGGGGGGGAGGLGGSGGGGGGAGFINIPTIRTITDNGGAGGGGGGGGVGGGGGAGASGGPGGGGGGAFELIAGGRLQVASGVQFAAKGGAGGFGTPGVGGSGGNAQGGGTGGGNGGSARTQSNGNDGASGASAGQSGGGGRASLGGIGANGASGGQAGGRGGDGGNGQAGGDGGSGGLGGAGGGGAGGSIKLSATVLEVDSSATVNVSGGLSARSTISTARTDQRHGQGGRIILGGNTDLQFDQSNNVTAIGGQPAATNKIGDETGAADFFTIRETNSYVVDSQGTPVTTPKIEGLIGGAATFGFIDGINSQNLGSGFKLSTSIDFDLSVANGVFQSAPTDALAALYRVKIGPEQLFRVDLDGDGDTTDDDFTGYDMLLFVNLTDLNLAAPRLGVQVGDSGSPTPRPLQFQGISDSSPTEVTALNARTIWATLVPEGDLTISASIAGTTLASNADLTAGYLSNAAGLVDGDQAIFITAGRPNLDEIGSQGIDIAFDEFSLVENSVDNDELYVVSNDRDALVVVNRAGLSVKQVIGEVRDETLGLSLTGFKQIHANPDGRFVYVLGDNGNLGIFRRDVATGVLSFQQIQPFEGLKTNVSATAQTLIGFEFQQDFRSASSNDDDDEGGSGFTANNDNAIVVLNETGGWRGDEWVVRSYVRDAINGTFRRTLADEVQPGSLTEVTRRGRITDATMVNNTLFVATTSNDLLALQSLRTVSGLFSVRQRVVATDSNVGVISRLKTSEVTGIDHLHVISNLNDRVTTYAAPFGLDYQLIEQVENGVNGVIGLDGPTDVTTSISGDYMYVTNDNGTVSVFERNSRFSPAQFVQVVRENVSGFDGLDRPASIIPFGKGALVATAGRVGAPATLVRLDAIPTIGGTLAQQSNHDVANVLVVMDDPFPVEPGQLSSVSWYLPTTVEPDFPPDIYPVLLEKNGDSWTVVGVGRRLLGSNPGLNGEDFVLQSGSAQTSGRYLGFRLDLYGMSKGVSYGNSDAQQAYVFPSSSTPAVGETLSGGTLTQRDYAFQATTLQRVKTGAVIVDFENIESLGVRTGGGSGVLTLRDATGSDVVSTSIAAGGGNDEVQVYDLSATTNVDLGDGNDRSIINTTSSGTLVIGGGQGQDEFDLRDVGPGSSTTLTGGLDPDQFRVDGSNLESGNTTTIDGGSPDGVFPGDGFLFDPKGLPVTNNNPQPGDGTVGVVGLGQVGYVSIEDIQQVGAPVISFTQSQLQISEGDTLSLSVTVDYAGSAPIGDVEWDLDNDGIFAEPDEPSGLTQNLTWTQLNAVAGINDDGEYTIRARATNSIGTTTRFRTLTVTDTPPTITPIPSMTIDVGQEFTIPLSATDPGNDNIIGWEILWENDPNNPGEVISTRLGADATSASYTFNSPKANDLILIRAYDDEYGPESVASDYAWTYNAGVNMIPTTGPYTILEGQDLTVAATPFGSPSSIQWLINGAAVLDAASGTIPWSTLQSLGDTPTLEVVAVYGTQITIPVGLTIENVAPIASFSATTSVPEGSPSGAAVVSFTNIFDTVPDVLAGFTFDYYFGDNPQYHFPNLPIETLNVPPELLAEDGRLEVRGVIRDKDGGTSEYRTSINVAEVAPNITFQASTNHVAEGVELVFNASVTDPGNEPLDNIVINWGDGVIEPISSLSGPIRHRFTDDGNRKVILSLWSDGQEYTSELNIQVNNAAPVISNLRAMPLVEGNRVVLTGDVVDPGTDDNVSVVVQWGDGQSDRVELAPGESTFEVYSTYANDGSYEILVDATDDRGAAAARTTLSVAIANDAPLLTLSPSTENPFESKTFTLSGLIADAGLSDRYNITIDWDDPQNPGNTPSITTINNSGPAFQASYTFADDRPDSQSGGKYQVTVTVVDVNDSSSTTTQTIDVEVNNFNPQINQLTDNASNPASPLPSGQPVVLNGLFTELGTQDTVTGTVDWGDGTTESITLNYTSTTQGNFTASRQYANDGSYIIKVTLTDDDGGTTEFPTFAFVGAADVTAPTVDIVDITPDPRATTVGTVNINFDESVRGFDIGDLQLLRDGVLVDLETLPLNEVSPSQYTIDLTSVTGMDGYYELSLDPANAGITDLAGNALAVDANEAFYKGVVPSRVESIRYDDGSNQRSVLRSITVRFDSMVTVAEGAFIVTTKEGRPVSVSQSVSTVEGKTEARLTFSGVEVDATGSLIDGNYRLEILDTLVTDQQGRALDGDGDFIAGGLARDDFFRLFGDSDGDRDVDGVDFLAFRRAFRTVGTDNAFDQAFDSDNDVDVDGIDFLAFRDAFRTRLDA
ncbi:MAG: hypothetical protein AAF802_01625 [Planctomycetota bacterium]